MPSPDVLFSSNINFLNNITTRIQARLDTFRNDPKYTNYELSNLPSPQILLEIISVAFWASLTREEGEELHFSLALTTVDKGVPYYPLDRPIPLSRESIRKLANAYDRSVASLRVDKDADGKMCIWGGLMHTGDGICVIDAIEPGLLAIRYTPETIAFIKGDSTTYLPIGHVHHLPINLINFLMGELPQEIPKEERENTALLLTDLAPKIRQHRHGGTIVIVPSNANSWKTSLEQRYEISSNFNQITTISLLDARPGRGQIARMFEFQERNNPDSVDRWINVSKNLRLLREEAQDRLVRLALVDGALILTTQRKVIGFGARLQRPSVDPSSPILVNEWDIIDNCLRGQKEITQIGGTRHQSAANFVHDNPSSLTLVVSEDGRVSTFTKKNRDIVLFTTSLEMLFL